MTTLAKAKLALSVTFIVLASFMIVTYDRQNMFIIKATRVVGFFDIHTPVFQALVLPANIRLGVLAILRTSYDGKKIYNVGSPSLVQSVVVTL